MHAWWWISVFGGIGLLSCCMWIIMTICWTLFFQSRAKNEDPEQQKLKEKAKAVSYATSCIIEQNFYNFTASHLSTYINIVWWQIPCMIRICIIFPKRSVSSSDPVLCMKWCTITDVYFCHRCKWQSLNALDRKKPMNMHWKP